MVKKCFVFISVLFLATFLLSGGQATYKAKLGQATKAKLKVFISVDMEGIAGIVSADQTSPDGKDYGLTRRWMTEETNAAIQGALDAGATEIVVNDSHGGMKNLIAGEINPAAYLITGTPKPLSMMQGVDEAFDAVIFIGYHAQAGSKDGVLDHTYSGSSIYSLKINGVEMGEYGFNAAIAGYYGVPVVLVAGDEEVCRQAKKLLGENLETAPVKAGIGRFAAKTLVPAKAQELIRQKAKAALEKRSQMKPFKVSSPVKFDIDFLYSYQADGSEAIPGVKRTGPRSVSFVQDDFIQGFKLFRALVSLARPD
jgi:D-amino peptidase